MLIALIACLHFLVDLLTMEYHISIRKVIHKHPKSNTQHTSTTTTGFVNVKIVFLFHSNCDSIVHIALTSITSFVVQLSSSAVSECDSVHQSILTENTSSKNISREKCV